MKTDEVFCAFESCGGHILEGVDLGLSPDTSKVTIACKGCGHLTTVLFDQREAKEVRPTIFLALGAYQSCPKIKKRYFRGKKNFQLPAMKTSGILLRAHCTARFKDLRGV